MDGYECAKELKKLFREKPDVACPIVACTAFVQEAEREKARQAGMDYYLTKPVTLESIKNTLKNIEGMGDMMKSWILISQ